MSRRGCIHSAKVLVPTSSLASENSHTNENPHGKDGAIDQRSRRINKDRSDLVVMVDSLQPRQSVHGGSRRQAKCAGNALTDERIDDVVELKTEATV